MKISMERLTAKLELRRHKVRRVRSAIHAGTYENDLKLIIALERVMLRLQRERPAAPQARIRPVTRMNVAAMAGAC